MITSADLQIEFVKDFGNDDPTALQRAVDRAYRQIGDAWGDLADDGALYLAAHLRMIAKAGAAGLSGPIAAKKVGEVSISYSPIQVPATDGSLGSTAYGREVLRMIMTLPGARIYLDPSDDYYDGIPDSANSFDDVDDLVGVDGD